MRASLWIFLLVCPVYSAPDIFQKAETLYKSTEYEASLRLLNAEPNPDAATDALAGKNYFMLGDYRKAAQFFEKAAGRDPKSSEYELWLGRAYGKRAETGGWLMAPSNASKARQYLEKAAALDSHNAEASNDLFDYYLNAPDIMGGGVEKAERIAHQITTERPAESNFELAKIAERRKQYAEAEAHFRKAIELAPGQPGRLIDLANFLAKRGRLDESEALFEQASLVKPSRPSALFARAKFDLEQRRNLEQARQLLRQYLESPLTPDDPPRAAAEKLLRQASQ